MRFELKASTTLRFCNLDCDGGGGGGGGLLLIAS